MSAWPGWEADVLRELGAIAGGNAVAFLSAWHACEGGTAAFNPLNTTQPAAGATNYNSVGVKNYPSEAVGLHATVQTLTNGFYPGLVRDLRSGTVSPAGIVNRNAAELSKWGTSTACLVARTGALPKNPTRPTPKTQLPPSVGSAAYPGRTAPQDGSAFNAWKRLTHALGTTMPTQARRARRARNRFLGAIR